MAPPQATSLTCAHAHVRKQPTWGQKTAHANTKQHSHNACNQQKTAAKSSGRYVLQQVQLLHVCLRITC